jgi:hypothetical protein
MQIMVTRGESPGRRKQLQLPHRVLRLPLRLVLTTRIIPVLGLAMVPGSAAR